MLQSSPSFFHTHPIPTHVFHKYLKDIHVLSPGRYTHGQHNIFDKTKPALSRTDMNALLAEDFLNIGWFYMNYDELWIEQI